jgi:hypothetical protein
MEDGCAIGAQQQLMSTKGRFFRVLMNIVGYFMELDNGNRVCGYGALLCGHWLWRSWEFSLVPTSPLVTAGLLRYPILASFYCVFQIVSAIDTARTLSGPRIARFEALTRPLGLSWLRWEREILISCARC